MFVFVDVDLSKMNEISQCEISFRVDFLFKQIMFSVCIVDAFEPTRILVKMRLFM